MTSPCKQNHGNGQTEMSLEVPCGACSFIPLGTEIRNPPKKDLTEAVVSELTLTRGWAPVARTWRRPPRQAEEKESCGVEVRKEKKEVILGEAVPWLWFLQGRGVSVKNLTLPEAGGPHLVRRRPAS